MKKMCMNVEEIPVFIEINLGTRIVIPASEGITASPLKREIERAHVDIFPELGFLSIHALMVPSSLFCIHVFVAFWPPFTIAMFDPFSADLVYSSVRHTWQVKRDSKFYRLPDSFPLKYAFRGFRNFWLLHADASLSESLEKTSLLGSTVYKRKDSGAAYVHNGKEVKRKKRRKSRFLQKRFPSVSFPDRVDPISLSLQGSDKKGYNNSNNTQKVSESCLIRETPCESNSGAISVSGIIDRYFTGFIEVGEVGSAFCSEGCMKFVNKSPSMKTMLCSPLPQELSSVSLRRYERSEVGKRLVTASGSLSRCQNSHGSSLLKDKRLREPDGCSVVRNLVFEIDDND